MVGKILRGIHKLVGYILAGIISPITIFLGYYASLIGRFSDFSIILSHIPLYFGEYVRYFYYRALLKKVGKNTIFKFGSYCQYREAEIGDNCLIGFYNALGLVKIGNDVLVGGYVNFTSGLKQHSFSDPTKKIREQHGERTKIYVGNDCWLGNNSVICANIGDRVVVGAGSVVNKELLEFGVYAGSPAKLIKKL